MNTLTALASAAFGSTACLTALSTVKWLGQQPQRFKLTGLAVTGVILCAVIATIATASRSVVLGFIVGAVLTPPVHRRIVQRRGYAATS
ncbi:hypothetical protein AW27_004345 [Streptomyces sp. PCS3-D2]|uniref:hypothetical protein n=1 Tax=Streptomyces sp. PCS3-D2 TaxID=1460244 RepID=UPI00044F708B|nr:hypothetical protein [Streptomyces sp. PCS3-D2]WKV70814.1 hypothetical protein AW27_004345 [Streptomyces sp. PCS3-D2]